MGYYAEECKDCDFVADITWVDGVRFGDEYDTVRDDLRKHRQEAHDE